MAFRGPEPRDAAPMWSLVRDSGALDLNSPYAYLLVCSHFAGTSVVAEAGGRLVGFVASYRPPPKPETVFVWQIGVDAAARGQGLGGRLLSAVLERPGCRGVRFLEATVTPSNDASRALFEGFARRRGAPCREEPGFGSELFPADPPHEPEGLLRIGPFPAPQTREES